MFVGGFFTPVQADDYKWGAQKQKKVGERNGLSQTI